MYYYDQNDRAPKRWAAVAAAIYALLLAGAFATVSFERRPQTEKRVDTMYIDLTEPVRPKAAEEPRAHQTEAPQEQVAKSEGEAAVAKTPDPRALFRMSKGSDEPAEKSESPHRTKGEESAAGGGTGAAPDGTDQLDKGLQGRGLVGSLPKPAYPGSRSGKVVVRVTVDGAGNVTGAAFEPMGSTVSDAELVDAAVAAARKARFTESRAAVQSGTITYIFRME